MALRNGAGAVVACPHPRRPAGGEGGAGESGARRMERRSGHGGPQPREGTLARAGIARAQARDRAKRARVSSGQTGRGAGRRVRSAATTCGGHRSAELRAPSSELRAPSKTIDFYLGGLYLWSFTSAADPSRSNFRLAHYSILAHFWRTLSTNCSGSFTWTRTGAPFRRGGRSTSLSPSAQYIRTDPLAT